MPLNPDLITQINSIGQLYEVGGTVRDFIFKPGEPQGELDFLVTGVALAKLQEILRKYGKVDLVGKSFGVIKFSPFDSGQTHDFAIPRTEISIGMAHRDFEVAYDPDLPIEIDLKRRDFTINAMAMEIPSRKLIDPYGGQGDLKSKIIKMVFPQAFIEDPLRILRGAQFAARLEFEIEPLTLSSMQKEAHLISTVSPERIADELNKMFTRACKPSIGFRYLLQIGALKIIMPELAICVGVEQPGGYHRWDVFDHTMVCLDASPKILHVRLAALFHDIAKPQTREIVEDGATFYGHDKLAVGIAEDVLKRLRYSNEVIENVKALVGKHMFSQLSGDKGIRRLIRSVGQDLIYDLLSLRRADIIAQGMGQEPSEVDEFEAKIKAEIDKKSPFGVRDLKISGDDIMREFKISPGPQIGQILNDLLEIVLDDPSTNEYVRLIERAKNFLNGK